MANTQQVCLQDAIFNIENDDFKSVRVVMNPFEDKERGVWVSVFDLLQHVAKKKNPRECFRSIEGQHPEVVRLSDNFKFDGQGQRMTPIMPLSKSVNLLQVTPGEAGDRVRTTSSELLCRYLRGDENLVEEVQANRVEQERLAVEEPDNPMRMFAIDHELRQQPSIVEAVQQQQYPLDVVTAASATGEPPEFVMNALSPEERSELILARKKILADRIEAAKKNAEAERIEAEAKEMAVLRRAKLEKEADERKAAQDKAVVRDENRIRAQTTRETLARSKAAELASLEECRRLCPDFNTRKRQAASSVVGAPATTRTRRSSQQQKLPLKGRAKKELIESPIPTELADDPDIIAYRAAGIPDDALPKDVEEAQSWLTLVTAEKQKIAESNTQWAASCGRPRPFLVHPQATSATQRPYPKWMWQPAARVVA